MGGSTSGSYGSANVVSSQTKTVGLGTKTSNQVKLNTFITAIDPDKKDTTNGSINSYYIGLKDSTVDSATVVSASLKYSGVGTHDLTLAGACSCCNCKQYQWLFYYNNKCSNDSGITFTVVGEDVEGNAQTEVIQGANKNIASGALIFEKVTKITASGNTADKVSAGIDKSSGRITL